MNADSFRGSIATVRTQIEDLQAEMEAGERCADHLQTDARVIDGAELNRLRLTNRLTALLEHADELRKSIREQRALLRELRTSFDELRRSLRGPRK